MECPKKGNAQGVRPVHIFFSDFLVIEDAGVLPAWLKVVDAERFSRHADPAQRGVGRKVSK